MPGKYISISNEAKERIRQPIDMDHMRDRYKTKNGIFSFPSPTVWTVEKNLFFLLKNSEYKNFELKYVYRPDYLSYDKYGTVILGQLLMIVNGVYTIEDFDLDKVVIPSFQAIVSICQDKFPIDRPTSELTEVLW